MTAAALALITEAYPAGVNTRRARRTSGSLFGGVASEDLGSGLGADGLAFPVALRGVLIGVLVLASRPGEFYAPRERKLLLHLTHEVGASLHAMFVNETQTFLAEVANGTLPSDKTRATAQQFMREHPAV